LFAVGCAGRVTTVAIDGRLLTPHAPVSSEDKSVAEKLFLPVVPVASGSEAAVSCYTTGFFSTGAKSCAAAGQAIAVTTACLEPGNAALPQCVEFISSQGAPGMESHEKKADGARIDTRVRGSGSTGGGGSRSSFDPMAYRARWHY
jgi:hypothetical protein